MFQLISLKENFIKINDFETHNECINYIENNNLVKYKIFNEQERKDLFFINALYWDENKKDFLINIDIIKEIKKQYLREIRSILFQKLDLLFIKSLESGDDQKRQYIINLKNQFRELTNIDLPDNEKELLDFIPNVFKEVYDLSI